MAKARQSGIPLLKKKNKIFNGHHGDIACDFYDRYAEDIALIYELNIPNHRFSISWSRILPQGTGSYQLSGN
jgi:beta-glucosidase